VTHQLLQRRRTLVGVILTITRMSNPWAPCLAQDLKDVDAGRELALKVCSPCHLVAPLPGPPFADIAKGEYASPTPLENFLRSTHSNVSHPGGMPRIDLSDEQIRAISAYIGSLREGR
jgi:mono/diheme cytochrome c family protein